MTVEYALRLARQWSQGHICTLREGEAKEYHKLVASLLEKERSRNEPLTLEQLRWMDGEPVWYGLLKKWALVSIRDAEVWLVTLWNEYVIRADDCENTGTMVYRRPPEGEGN